MTSGGQNASRDGRRLVCLGFGFSARAVCALAAEAGYEIVGTARSPERLDLVTRLGGRGVVFDGQSRSAELASLLAGASHVLVSVPPGNEGDPALALHGADLEAAAGLSWIGYLSTVGVYGDRQGGWVDESTPPAPTSQRSRWRLAADEQWLEFGRRTGTCVEVFRLAGIYGPGRSAFDALRKGTARRIDSPGQVFNRIHVEDIARGVWAAMTGSRRGGVYNFADDEPAPAHEVTAFAAGLLGLDPPPLVPIAQASLSPMAASFYAECKRVRNGQLKTLLGGSLRYPSYREGLRGILRAEQD
ncbi:MAG: SDR family oxidoreductase [Hyphomicrobiaceae bacterium]